MSSFTSNNNNNNNSSSSSSSSSRDPTEEEILAAAMSILRENGLPLSLLPQKNDTEERRELKISLRLSMPHVLALKKYVESQNAMPPIAEEDFALSPASGLKNCLQSIPDVTVLQSLIGPGDCIFQLMPTASGLTREYIESIVNDIREDIRNLTFKPNVDEEMLLAVRLYTVELPIAFFVYVNTVLNTQDRVGLRHIAPFMRLLIKALYALEDSGFCGTAQAYRGIRIGSSPAMQRKFNNYETVFQQGSLITFAGFTSVTRLASNAQQFGDFIFFHFLSVRGVDVSSVSAHPLEQELLVVPPAVFRVDGVFKLHGKLTVTLTHVEQKEACYLRKEVAILDEPPHAAREARPA
jgi:hypothetical protein